MSLPNSHFEINGLNAPCKADPDINGDGIIIVAG